MTEIFTLREEIRNFKDRLKFMRELRDEVKGKFDEAKQDIEDRQQAQAIFQMMSELLSEENESIVEKICTTALQESFPDEDLSVVVEHYTSHGKPAVELKICDKKRRFSGPPMTSFGHGPAYFIGILLRILSIIKQKKMARVLFLDEPLNQVSFKYRKKAASILRRICDTVESGGLGFSILMITHDPIFKSVAHKSYTAVLDEDGSSLKLLSTPLIKDEDQDE